jgi:hypothetical protein
MYEYACMHTSGAPACEQLTPSGVLSGALAACAWAASSPSCWRREAGLASGMQACLHDGRTSVSTSPSICDPQQGGWGGGRLRSAAAWCDTRRRAPGCRREVERPTAPRRRALRMARAARDADVRVGERRHGGQRRRAGRGAASVGEAAELDGEVEVEDVRLLGREELRDHAALGRRLVGQHAVEAPRRGLEPVGRLRGGVVSASQQRRRGSARSKGRAARSALWSARSGPPERRRRCSGTAS